MIYESEQYPEFILIHPLLTSFNADAAKIWGIQYCYCVDFNKHYKPHFSTVYVEIDDLETTLRPDVIAYTKFNPKDYNKNKLSLYKFKMSMKEIIGDKAIVSFMSKSDIEKVFKNTNIMFGEIENETINLTKFITHELELETDRWTTQGYKVPPFSDPLFIDTCFYGLVREKLWHDHQNDNIAFRGAVILSEILYNDELCNKLINYVKE